MNRLSLAFLSTLAACAAESSTPAPATFRDGVARAAEPTAGVVTQHPSTDPGCESSSAMRQPYFETISPAARTPFAGL